MKGLIVREIKPDIGDECYDSNGHFVVVAIHGDHVVVRRDDGSFDGMSIEEFRLAYDHEHN